MDNLTCQMNCHACTLQEGATTKSTCASLLMPSMFVRVLNDIQELSNQVQELKGLSNKKDAIVEEITEIKLPKK